MSLREQQRSSRGGGNDEEEYDDDEDEDEYDEDEEAEDDDEPADDDNDEPEEDGGDDYEHYDHEARPPRQTGQARAPKPRTSSSAPAVRPTHESKHMRGTCHKPGQSAARWQHGVDPVFVATQRLEQAQHLYRDIGNLNDILQHAVVLDPEVKIEFTAKTSSAMPYYHFHLSRQELETRVMSYFAKNGGYALPYEARDLFERSFLVSYCGSILGRQYTGPESIIVSSADVMNNTAYYPSTWSRDGMHQHTDVVAAFTGTTTEMNFASPGKYRDHECLGNKAHSICHFLSGITWIKSTIAGRADMVAFRKESIYGKGLDELGSLGSEIQGTITPDAQRRLFEFAKEYTSGSLAISTKTHYIYLENAFAHFVLPHVMGKFGATRRPLDGGLSFHILGVTPETADIANELHRSHTSLAHRVSELFAGSKHDSTERTFHVRLSLKLVCLLPAATTA